MRKAGQYSNKAIICLLALLMIVVPALHFSRTNAAELTFKKITIGSPNPSANTTHNYSFQIGTGGPLGSMSFEYCSNSPLFSMACTAPAGLDVSSVVLSAQTGETGFSVDALTSANRIVISRTIAGSSPGPVTYNFSNVINPSTPNQSVFVRISTYPTIDTSGAYTDSGSVVFSINSGLGVGGYVPPYLIFCVGVTVGPQCTSSSGSFTNFSQLTPTQTKTSTTQFSGATNDPGGYSTYVLGTTMTSGNNVITPMNAPQASNVGTSQFGLNLRANTSPSVGANSTGIGSTTASANYNQVNLFKFTSGDLLASSSNSTDYNIFTVSYVVNVSENQAPGIYSTTLTYVAIAAF